MRSWIPVLWALLLAGSSGAMGESASPLAPMEQKGQQINGLTWTVRLAKEFTVFDTVEAFCGLYNSSDRQFTFDTGSPDPKRTYPQLVLARKGGQRAVAELAPKKGFWHQYGNYKPKPGEVAHSFYVVSLRQACVGAFCCSGGGSRRRVSGAGAGGAIE